MQKTPNHRSLLLLLTLLLAACTGQMMGLQEPNVMLSDITSASATVFEQRYNLVLRIQNPNNADLRLSGLNYAVSLNDQEFARGDSSQHVVIPALGEKTVHVTVTSGALDWLKQIDRMSKNQSGTLTYSVSGTLFLDNFPGGRLSFSHAGSFSPQ